MRAFVIDWDEVDMQNAVSKLEGMGHTVCGSAYRDPDQAEAAIRSTRPDVVVAWANRDAQRTESVLHAVLAEREGKDPAPLPVVFVDAEANERSRLAHCAAPAVFRDVAHLSDGLEEINVDVQKARKALEHARAARSSEEE